MNPSSLTSSLLTAALLAPAALVAQDSSRIRLVAAGGPTLNDLEVGGMVWLGVAAVEWRPLSSPLVIDSSLRYLTFTAASREHYLLAEISAQWELRLGPVRPFLGGGGGLAWRLRPGDVDRGASTHVGAGVRAEVTSRLGIRAEARLRSADPFGDFTLGLSWGFGQR